MKRELRTSLAIVAAFVVLIAVMVGYNAYATDRERPTALVVDVTARQRTLTERYIKDTILVLDGVQADPDASAEILSETATALLEGGDVVTPQGSLDQRVRIPAATNRAVREKLEHERKLIAELLASGRRLREAGKASPTFAADLQDLRVQGAQLSSVTGDAAGEITKDSQARLSRLVTVEIALGLLSAIAALGMALLLRRTALRQSARFRSLVHNATDLITVLDEHAVATYQSPSSERVLGYRPADLIHRKMTDLVHPDDKKRVIEAFASAYERPGTTIALRFRLRHADGRWIVLEGTATNLLGDRSVRGFVLNSRDVTERERSAAELSAARDEALSASVTKSQFLASMSHEIRTPMNAIIGLNDLLLDTPLDREQREFAGGVQSAAEGLLGIINDILDFSKVEAGRLEIEAVPFDLGLVVEDVAALLGETANAKHVELLAHCQSGVPTAVVGDPTRLRQVLLNLTSNAVKFTERGEVVIRVRLLQDEPAAVRLRFEVSDTGVGIAAADVERLFDPFSQADASTTRRFGGTGLGLAIVKQLVKLMGGSLGVESEVDVGSTFWFELRLAKQANLVTKLPYGDELTGLRVLIVDDNETNRLILREQLGSWGMHTDEAADAKGALGLLRSASSKADAYDVVVLDLNMPGMDGLQLAHAINVDSQIARPTMFMLSSSGRVARDDAATAGLAGTLTKPVRQSELFNCLMGGLSTHRVVVDDVPPQPAAEARARGHVLLVEDNAMNQLVARKLLTKLGYTVDVSRNGVEALEALEGDARYVAVLMDCQMPVMDGYAATREIRRREGGTRHTPIIAMTAAAMEGDREACLDAGMDDYLTKPIRPDAVARTLAQWIPSGDPADATAARPTEAPDDDAAALDADRIAMLRELDDGDGMLLASIVDEFVAGAQRNLDDLREAVAEGDPEAVERAAHALKGASANLGATQLADLSGHLEALGRARALGGAAPAVEDIEREFERVRAALARVLTVR